MSDCAVELLLDDDEDVRLAAVLDELEDDEDDDEELVSETAVELDELLLWLESSL